MQRLGALSNKILIVAINERNHGPGRVQAPCYELGVGCEDGIGTRALRRDEGGRDEIAVQFAGAGVRGGSFFTKALGNRHGGVGGGSRRSSGL
jgi:hypothetical protein